MDRTLNELEAIQKLNVITAPSIDSNEYAEVVTINQSLMRKENTLTDVILKCGDKTFPAHKVILATHSPYFRAMFTVGMKESSEDVVELQGEDSVSLLRLLEYMYSGDIDATIETVALLGAAELLQVDTVSKLCCEYLLQSLSPNRFLNVWNTMDTYGKIAFVALIVEYLACAFAETSESQEFLDLSIERLLSVLKSPKLSVHSETILTGILKWVKHSHEVREEYLGELLGFVKFTSLSTAFLVDMIENEPLMLKSPSLSQKVNAGLSVKLWKRTKVMVLLRIISPQEIELCCLNLKEHCQYFKFTLKPDNALTSILQICSNKNTILLITATHILSFNLETRRWTWYSGALDVSADAKISCIVSNDCVFLFTGSRALKYDLSVSGNEWQPIASPQINPDVSTMIDVDGTLYAISPVFLVQRYNSMGDKWSMEETHQLCSNYSCVLNRVATDQILLSTFCGEKIYLLQYDPGNSLPFTLYSANQNLVLLMERKLPSVHFRARIKCFHVTEAGGKYTIHLIDAQGRWWSLEEENSFWKKNGVYVGLARSSTSYTSDLPEHSFSYYRYPQRNISVWEYDDINGVWFREISFTRSSQNALAATISNETRPSSVSWKTGLDQVDHGIIAEMHVD